MKLFSIMVLAAMAATADDRVILAAQQRWIDGYNTRDARVLEEIEASDFHIVYGDSTVKTKADQLNTIRRPIPAGAEYRIAIESTEVRQYGDAAVVTGVVVEQGKHKDSRPFSHRSRYTDTWILQQGHWRVVSSHLTDLK